VTILSNRLEPHRVTIPAPGAVSRSVRGVTLVELMLAMLILAGVTLSVSGLMSYGHRTTQKDFRQVIALQMLTDRMNQLLIVPYASLSAALTNSPQTFSNTTVAGVDLLTTIPTQAQQTAYTFTLVLTRIPVTFGVQPIDVAVSSPDFVKDQPSSWRFAAYSETNGIMDGSAVDRPFKVIKVHLRISWREPIQQVDRLYELVSFNVDLVN